MRREGEALGIRGRVEQAERRAAGHDCVQRPSRVTIVVPVRGLLTQAAREGDGRLPRKTVITSSWGPSRKAAPGTVAAYS